MTDGEIDALVNDHLARLKKGEISVALGYDTHLYTPVVDARFSVLILPPDVCRDFTASVNGRTISRPFVFGGEAAERIAACFREIRSHEKEPLITKGNLYIILGIIAQNVVFRDGAPYAGSSLISKILLYIHGHFKEDVSFPRHSALTRAMRRAA